MADTPEHNTLHLLLIHPNYRQFRACPCLQTSPTWCTWRVGPCRLPAGSHLVIEVKTHGAQLQEGAEGNVS